MKMEKRLLLQEKGGSRGSQSHCMTRDMAKLETEHDVCYKPEQKEWHSVQSMYYKI